MASEKQRCRWASWAPLSSFLLSPLRSTRARPAIATTVAPSPLLARSRGVGVAARRPHLRSVFSETRESGRCFVVAALFGASRSFFFYPASTALGLDARVSRACPATKGDRLEPNGVRGRIGHRTGHRRRILCALSPSLGYAACAVLFTASFVAVLLINGAVTRPAHQPGSSWLVAKEGPQLSRGRTKSSSKTYYRFDLFAVLFGGVTALTWLQSRPGTCCTSERRAFWRVKDGSPGDQEPSVWLRLAVMAWPIRRRAGLFRPGGVAVFAAAILLFALFALDGGLVHRPGRLGRSRTSS